MKTIIVTTLTLILLALSVSTSCRMYETLEKEEAIEEGDTPDQDAESAVPLKLEITEGPIWATINQEKEFTITSNKNTQVTYIVKHGDIALKQAEEEKEINSGQKIKIKKGKNTFIAFTAEQQDKGILLHFQPEEKNTNDKDHEGEEYEIKPLQIKIWTDVPSAPDFKIEITHDTPDTLFVQYNPVRFEIKIVPATGADTNGHYTYEYEIIKGDAIVRIGEAAPNGTKLKPEERIGISANSTVILYATPLTKEPTWIRIIARKNFGDLNYVGAFLNMDYIKPRGLPKVYFYSIDNLGTTGNPYECKNDKNAKSGPCQGNKFFHYYSRMKRFNIGGNCYRTGIYQNDRVKYKIRLKQDYYVPNQKYRLRASIGNFGSPSSYIPFQDFGIEFLGGHTGVIDYDYLIARGEYLEFYLLMPDHSNIQFKQEEDFFQTIINVALDLRQEGTAEYRGSSSFTTYLFKFSSCQVD